MQLIFDNITPIRHRRRDPKTSVDAAKRAEIFADSHKGRILACMRSEPGSWTAAEISVATGLTVVQIDRRLHELEKDGLIEPTGLIVGGFQCWKLT